MSATITIDPRSVAECSAALRQFGREAQRAIATATRDAAHIALRDVQRLTPTASRADIDRETDPASKRLLYATLTKRGRAAKGRGLQRAVDREFNRRRNAVGHIRQSWQLDHRAAGMVGATARNPSYRLANTAAGADTVAHRALVTALNRNARRLESTAATKMRKAAKRHST